MAGQRFKLAFNFSLHLLASAHHEDDHGDDEEGRRQHDPALNDVFVEVQTRDQDGNANAAHERCPQGCKDGFPEVAAADLGQVGEGNAYDQGRFDPLAERDYEGLQHN